uniref:Transmembrane protein 117 n=1 Tax=Anas zonorhyncha TaxID=75864 RepID=A0A8C0A1F6_9AVES
MLRAPRSAFPGMSATPAGDRNPPGQPPAWSPRPAAPRGTRLTPVRSPPASSQLPGAGSPGRGAPGGPRAPPRRLLSPPPALPTPGPAFCGGAAAVAAGPRRGSPRPHPPIPIPIPLPQPYLLPSLLPCLLPSEPPPPQPSPEPPAGTQPRRAAARQRTALNYLRMDKDFRYYFQHPWSRLVVAYLVIFFNFLIFAEDPVSHSQTEANVIVVGLIAGKFLFHQRLFGQLLRLKMFREDHGSWMTMFFSTILFLFIFSHIYNLFLIMEGNMSAYIITDFMGIRNENFMKVAAVGTWMGDFVTAWMVTDMMLQDKPYPDWGKSARAFWKKGNVRIILFWTVLFTLTSVVVLVITTDWISWDKLNRGFLPSDEVSRAFLASFILVFDLLIVMQDWEFPHFMGDVEVNLPGLPSAHMQLKVPYFQKIFKEEYHIHITGKWFNYGIIFLVLILDLNMWKNQIFYKPHEYGQYIGPGQKIYTVKDSESLKDLNRTKLSWEWRSNNTNPLTNRTYAEGDMFLHSRYIGSSLDVKCLAFIPSLLAFALFGFFIWFFGRFQKTDQGMENLDKSYTRMKRKSPSDMGMTRENTQVLVEEPLSFQEPHLVSIKSDLSEIVFNSSLLTSENLNAQLNEQESPLQPVPESSVPQSNPPA